MKHTLLLASKSPSRKMLLEQSRIPFTVIEQNADEMRCDWTLPLPDLVRSIAAYKMEQAVMPRGHSEGERCFVLTADTLSQDNSDGKVQGKPIDRADAIDKIKRARMGSCLYTAFCIHRYMWRDGSWHLEMARQGCVRSEYLFVIPDNLIDWYLDNSIGMETAGAVAVEGLGAQFLQSVNGSHSCIMGLPLFEVRQALTEIGFFDY